MGWNIGLITNQLPISPVCAKELNPILEDLGFDPVRKGKLSFNENDSEHMDFLHEPAILSVLEKYEVTGRVRFASVEGDNAGRIWEHRFTDGKYVCVSSDLSEVELPE